MTEETSVEIKENNVLDPRDYIPSGAFQKQIQLLAPQILENPEIKDKLPLAFRYSEDPETNEKVAFAIYFANEEDMLITTHESAFFTTLPRDKADFVYSLLETINLYFPPPDLIPFIKNIVHFLKSEHGQEKQEEQTFFVEITKSLLNALKPETQFSPVDLSQYEIPNELKEIISLALSLLPEEKRKDVEFEIKQELSFSDKSSLSNQITLLATLRKVFSRLSINNTKNIITEKDLARSFPIQPARKIKNKDELNTILQQMSPLKPYPDLTNKRLVAEKIEFIDPAQIVGNMSNEPWNNISRTESNRNLWNLIEKIQSGKVPEDLISGSPIKITCVNERLWVGNDGTHRIAAFKALGVKRVPVIVRYYE